MFNGSPSLLVANVLEDEQIDSHELNRLKKLIADAPGGRQRRVLLMQGRADPSF